METALIAPANYSILGIPTVIFSFLIPIVGVGLFAYIMAIRIAPLVLAAPDLRFNRLGERIVNVVRIWLLQTPCYLLWMRAVRRCTKRSTAPWPTSVGNDSWTDWWTFARSTEATYGSR